MFRDEARILVASGAGGNGCVSFRREKYIPRGGPDGGDGGAGGSVYLVADAQVNTLYHVARSRTYRARRGEHGSGANRTGASAPDVEIPVPVGTEVRDGAHSRLLKDLDEPGQRVCVARGGKGGRGNARFATATRRTPRKAEKGRPGEERELALTLKLLADAGLVGLPNAGKSTLLSVLSAAHPEIADYPFTTLSPVLGIVEVSLEETFVLADLPGLIEGAHAGSGLGDRFLRHIERTRVLVHLVEAAPADGSDPAENYRVIRRELGLYSAALAEKPEVLVLSKVDTAGGGEEVANRLATAAGGPVHPVSAATGAGLPALVSAIQAALAGAPRGV